MKQYEKGRNGKWFTRNVNIPKQLSDMEERIMMQTTHEGRLFNGKMESHPNFRTEIDTSIPKPVRKPHPNDTFKPPVSVSTMDEFCTKVLSFHKKFDHLINETPTLPAAKVSELRVSLLEEETKELKVDGIKAKNLTEVADALCDLQYVLSGAIITFGMQHIFQELFSEVDRSNMSKACQTLAVANATVEHYAKDKVEAFIVDKDDGFLVFRKSDNKLLKSIGYSPANLEPILAKVLNA